MQGPKEIDILDFLYNKRIEKHQQPDLETSMDKSTSGIALISNSSDSSIKIMGSYLVILIEEIFSRVHAFHMLNYW